MTKAFLQLESRVERAIRYVRDNSIAAREWKDLDDLNAQAEHWRHNQAANRPCPEDKTDDFEKSAFESLEYHHKC